MLAALFCESDDAATYVGLATCYKVCTASSIFESASKQLRPLAADQKIAHHDTSQCNTSVRGSISDSSCVQNFIEFVVTDKNS